MGGRPFRSAAALAAALLALGGCQAGERTELPGDPVATNVVEMPRHYRFDPPAIRVAAGTTVTWRNTDDFTHSVRLEDGDGAVHTIPPGDSARIRFDEPGVHRYVCTLHPHDMRGVVIVDQVGER